MEQRQLLFRALCYADDVKQMVYFGMQQFDNGIASWPLVNLVHIDEYLSPLMQCTGLADKNGKDIYEGDILKSPFFDDTFVPVVYDNQHAQFTYGGAEFNVEAAVSSVEVLGNIYENPELIK